MADHKPAANDLLDARLVSDALRVARRIIGSGDCRCGRYSAADAVQEAAAKVCRRGRLESHPNPRALVLAAVTNCAFDHLRSHRTSLLLLRTIAPAGEARWQRQAAWSPVALAVDPERRLIEREEQRARRRAVLDALRRLPPCERELTVRKYWYEQTEATIARTMRMTGSYSVRNRLRRIRKLLRRLLTQAAAGASPHRRHRVGRRGRYENV
jgi:RNA polymerase sigma factor (sigma-70 family)